MLFRRTKRHYVDEEILFKRSLLHHRAAHGKNASRLTDYPGNICMSFSGPFTDPQPLLKQRLQPLLTNPFVPARGLQNGHWMTIIGTKRPRQFSLRATAAERREFQTEADTRVVAYCHWQPDRQNRPTAFVIHGLEGNADAAYVMGTADKAFAAGFNVIRYNVRNCGDTLHLSPKLYHSGLTVDLHHVLQELIAHDGLPELYFIGFSMGGNQALKLVGELGAQAPPQLRGVCAVSPPIDLAACATSIAQRENWLYEIRFLRSLAKTVRRKAELFPGRFDVNRLRGIKHLRDWDDAFQPYNGFRDAAEYYAHASSLPYLPQIRIPALIITAEDDPFIPIQSFYDKRLTENPSICLLAPRHGGHVAFCGRGSDAEDRAWAENRILQFCQLLMQTETPAPQHLHAARI